MKKKSLVLFILILLFLSTKAFSASISGRVTFKNGNPVRKLKIICESTYNTFVAYTNNQGMYKFILSDDLHTYYYILVELPGKRRVKVGKRPIHGTHETVDIKLRVNSLKELQ